MGVNYTPFRGPHHPISHLPWCLFDCARPVPGARCLLSDSPRTVYLSLLSLSGSILEAESVSPPASSLGKGLKGRPAGAAQPDLGPHRTVERPLRPVGSGHFSWPAVQWRALAATAGPQSRPEPRLTMSTPPRTIALLLTVSGRLPADASSGPGRSLQNKQKSDAQWRF